jgi:hypothetical protein
MFDMPEPELLFMAVPALLLEPELSGLLLGDAGALLVVLLFELEEVESAGLLLQPSTTIDRQRPRVSAAKRVRMIPSMSGWFIRKLDGAQMPLAGR